MKRQWSIKMLNLSVNVGLDQNLEIWVPNVKSIKMLKFEGKTGDWSNVDILLQKWKSIKMLEFDWKIRNGSEHRNLRTKLGIDQNVEIWVQNVKSIKLGEKGRLIKMSKLEWKGNDQLKCWIWRWMWESIKMLKFECKMSSQSKCWNLSEKGRLIIMSKFEWKGESMKTLKFEDRGGCYLNANGQIDQNVETWVKRQ